jgi:wyosine [tRNA(Phe)-imidazoG37] synthetase (radical SAM superfamily)
MKYVFGPVPSRRLRRSLGIDPTPPPRYRESGNAGPDEGPRAGKACNWNCVYCQLGPTRPFTLRRSSFFPPQELFDELKSALAADSIRQFDWIIFVGSGEPTLNKDLGALIRGVKELSDAPVAVITNGSLLLDAEVRSELLQADAVLPTLDAGDSKLYRAINRPPSEYAFEEYIRGLEEFSREYEGKLWIEVMLIKGMNDGKEALCNLAAALERIGPVEVHIVLPTRPPAEERVRPADAEGLDRAKAILGRRLGVLLPDQGRGGFGDDAAGGGLDPLISIITRHPLSEEDFRRSLSEFRVDDVDSTIASL